MKKGSRMLALGLLGILAGTLPAAGPSSEEATKKELARFEGTWRFASIEVEGTSLPKEHFKGSRLILEGAHFTAKEPGVTYEGTFKLDVSKTPKQIDVVFEKGPGKGDKCLGIYELEGDTYKVCMGMPGKSRPTGFVSKAGSGHVLEVLHREPKPKEKEDVLEKEMAKLEGTWQLVSAEDDGKVLPEERAKQTRVVIKSGSHTVYFGDKAVVEGVTFRIDPTTKPKQVEDTLKDGRKIHGIYELDGDTLRSCVGAPDKDRPTEFTGKAGSGQTLRVFRRVKE